MTFDYSVQPLFTDFKLSWKLFCTNYRLLSLTKNSVQCHWDRIGYPWTVPLWARLAPSLDWNRTSPWQLAGAGGTKLYHATCPYKQSRRSLIQSEWTASLHWLLSPSTSSNLFVHQPLKASTDHYHVPWMVKTLFHEGAKERTNPTPSIPRSFKNTY